MGANVSRDANMKETKRLGLTEKLNVKRLEITDKSNENVEHLPKGADMKEIIKMSDKLIDESTKRTISVYMFNCKVISKIDISLTYYDKKIMLFGNYVKSLHCSECCDKIINFCCSLTDSDMHTQIKYLIAENYEAHDLHDTYVRTLREIYINDLTDFTITFANKKTFSCLKLVLSQIPFFKIMFEEFKEMDCFETDINFDVGVPIIKMFYGFVLDLLDKFIDMFELADKWLLDDVSDVFVKYLSKNKWIIRVIEFDELAILTNHLTNIWSSTDNKELKGVIDDILGEYHLLDLKDKILKFEKWVMIFNDEQKLDAIKISGNYKLLNVSGIDPKIVIEFLILQKIFDIYDIYNMACSEIAIIGFGPLSGIYDIYNMACSEIAIIGFGPLSGISNDTQMIVQITKYYPQFKCKILSKTNFHVNNDELYGSFNLLNSLCSYCNIFVGTNIIVLKKGRNDCINNMSTITKITFKGIDIKQCVYGSNIKLNHKGLDNVPTNSNNMDLDSQVDGIWTIKDFVYDKN